VKANFRLHYIACRVRKSFIDIYTGQSYLKWVVLGLSIIIGGGSILYTNQLVNDIKEREYRQVSLYAKSLEYLAKASGSDELIFILDEVVQANTTIPVILADELKRPEFYKNIPEADALEGEDQTLFLVEKIDEMEQQRPPVSVSLAGPDGAVVGVKFIYYENSFLLTKLRYYPYVQLLIIFVFGFIIFVIFNYSRSSEQNRVWVGLAKETAHQLGTPLSALLGWIEYFKVKYAEDPQVAELEKDIQRLETITARFSSIGSAQKLEVVSLSEFIESNLSYLKLRLSQRVAFTFEPKEDLYVSINPDLFSWVFENLIKNAVDAMEGEGQIIIQIGSDRQHAVWVDIADTGKGIPKSKTKQVFKPGFTTKSRGWGLGLTLVKRIVENYHEGRIFVKQSDPGKGTTFRMLLKRASNE
jgi:two-component sensor histidine kinase